MMHVEDFRDRAAARDAATRLVMMLIGLVAAIVIALIIYAIGSMVDRGLSLFGAEMEAFADSQTGVTG